MFGAKMVLCVKIGRRQCSTKTCVLENNYLFFGGIVALIH